MPDKDKVYWNKLINDRRAENALIPPKDWEKIYSTTRVIMYGVLGLFGVVAVSAVIKK